MEASKQFCPNLACSTRGKTGEGNIRIHCRKRERYRCRTCSQTFSARRGTMLEGLRKPMELVVIVVTLLAYGCPIQAIVHAYGLDERTVASWRDRAGTHCHTIHHAIVETGKLDLVHVQADEIRVKGRSLIAWMGLAMMVSTRLWIAGIVSPTRDRSLADQMFHQVRACSQTMSALLISTDGWAAYPGSIKRAFREKVKKVAGRGRACLEVWPDLCIATVIKRAEKKRVVEVTRKMTLGALEHAEQLLHASHGGTVLNTAFIERLNGTMRQRLAALTTPSRMLCKDTESISKSSSMSPGLEMLSGESKRRGTVSSCFTENPIFAGCLSFSANRIGGHSPTSSMPSNHLTALAMMDLAGLADLVEVCSRMLDLDGNHVAERGCMALILHSKLPHDGVIPTIGHIA